MTGNSSGLLSLGVNVTAAGTQGAVLYMYDRVNATNFPRKYAVEGGKSVLHNFTTPATVGYGFSLHGPNGFVRQFGGKTKPLGDVSLRYDPENVAGPSVVVMLIRPLLKTRHNTNYFAVGRADQLFYRTAIGLLFD